jgi:hypothetical protein
MKKILFIALLLIPFLGFSQTTKPIDGFLGIKFGSSKLAVIAAIKAKGGIIDKAASAGDRVAFTNVKLGHRSSVGFAVRFFNNKAFFAVFLFQADVEPKTVAYYDNLVSDITDIYGAGAATREFRSGFVDGDGNESTAIENGYADLYTVWNANNNSMRASISNKLLILLTYQDDALRAEADAAQKAKEKGDF